MARYIVGDIHACLSDLKALLQQVDFNPRHDQLWSVGDLIGRGPQPLATLEFLADLGPAFQCTLGNHDLHTLAVLCEVRAPHNKDNTLELLQSKHRDRWIDWLRKQPLMLVDPQLGHVVSHAGVHPAWTIDEASQYAHEVEAKLVGPHYVRLLEEMYGNEPTRWRDELFGIERDRFIINTFTRMRYLTPDGALDFSQKAHPQDVDRQVFIPWYEQWSARGWTLFFGHWATLMGETGRPDIIGLDTGCVWGEALTMINVESGERIVQTARST
ncbi:symmetrical bis(5'-nucleosyl)-tetraphosphatase [Aliidiomarina sanyensis]|uniref:bis(5'-nucleosyl)-tetraphosphatase (symmetrical) n=1 Tax=Aliidiomarina sanyensis TaxID=1249555 RepID=A0A432WCL5_9GAMM|nr:symmetrical bis(5'-nucleosyl)-tetraphosphatase [Aliidiomarina sanyensis]RUO30163.1 bis(5'-nucleosyl)-tetraphosphatase [Aliidiomarina sanyensis]